MSKATVYVPLVAKKPQEVIGVVQGQVPDSINEWYVAQGLDQEKLFYYYQFTIGGGDIRGGQVIDFLVQLGGWIPVFVNGSWWHDIRHDPELPLKLNAARARFHKEPVILEEAETNTAEKALKAIRQKIEG